MKTSYTRLILIASFLCGLCVMLAFGLAWYSNTSHIKQHLQDIHDQFETSNLIHIMSDSSRMRALSAHRMLLMDDIIDRYEEQDNFHKYANIFLTAKDKLLSHAEFNNQDRLAWDKIKDKITVGGELHAQIINHLIERRDQQATQLLKSKSKFVQDEFIYGFNNLLSEKSRQVEVIISETHTLTDQYFISMIFIGGASIALFSGVFVFVYRHISKTENALLQAHAQEKSENEYKSEFLIRVSHEFRTPLNAILGFTQVINMDKDSGLPAEYTIYFKHIEQSGWKLLTLIDDILEMTKICGHTITLDIESVSLITIISACIDSLADMAEEYKINCSYSLADNGIDTIKTDLNRISQIMENLLTNAIKYNHPGGTVSVLVSETDRQMIRVEVKNSGAGISDTDLDKLFKPFARIGKQDKDDGPGIGLALAKGLVECLHGQIGVESLPGSMTVFWFELPKNYSDTL